MHVIPAADLGTREPCLGREMLPREQALSRGEEEDFPEGGARSREQKSSGGCSLCRLLAVENQVHVHFARRKELLPDPTACGDLQPAWEMPPSLLWVGGHLGSAAGDRAQEMGEGAARG